MSMDSYSKRRALAIWDSLEHDDTNEIAEHPVRGLVVYHPGLYNYQLRNPKTSKGFPDLFKTYYRGARPWKDLYEDLTRYVEYKKPWKVIRPEDKE